jgi:hypothetical protein
MNSPHNLAQPEWLRAAELATAAGALSSEESSDLLPVIQRA